MRNRSVLWSTPPAKRNPGKASVLPCAPPPLPVGWLFTRALAYLHVRVGEAAGRQVVGVHSHRLLFGSHAFIFVKGQWIHRTLII